jgi:hypothetical protein
VAGFGDRQFSQFANVESLVEQANEVEYRCEARRDSDLLRPIACCFQR